MLRFLKNSEVEIVGICGFTASGILSCSKPNMVIRLDTAIEWKISTIHDDERILPMFRFRWYYHHPTSCCELELCQQVSMFNVCCLGGGGGQGGQTNHGMLGVVQSSFLCQRKILTTDNYISTPSLFICLLIIHLFASCCFCWFSLLLLYFNFCCQTCLFSVLLALNGHIEKMQLCQCQQVCFILITNRTQVACT